MQEIDNLENNLLLQQPQPQQQPQQEPSCKYLKSHPLKIILFFMQLTLSIGLISFSLYQVATLPEDSEKSVYFSMVSGLVGYWLPSPKSKLKNK